MFDEEDDFKDCGLMPDGTCQKVGSEECYFCDLNPVHSDQCGTCGGGGYVRGYDNTADACPDCFNSHPTNSGEG